MRRYSFLFGLGSLLGMALLGCGSATPENPAEQDVVDDALQACESVGILEGSAEACGMISVANEASFDELDHAVGLNSIAAKNIAAYRAGADGVVGTADDGYFDSIAELDRVAFVGPATVLKLASYVKDQARECKQVDLRFLSIADFHGQLDPVGTVGGAAVLSSYFKADRIANPRTLLLASGDSFGASPPLAAFFDEKPVIEVMNLMGFDAESPGNHSFDKGTAALESLIEMSDYPYLAANLTGVDENMECDGLPGHHCIAPFKTFWKGGVKVAVIGLMTPELPMLVKPGALGTITVADPVASAMAARDKAAKQGATVFVALAHIGGTPGTPPTGPIIDLANQLTGFDLILGGHTHNKINAVVNNTLVVETQTQGANYSRAMLRYDFASKSVVQKSAEIVTPVTTGIIPDQAIVDLLKPYRAQVSAILDAPIGVSTGVFQRGSNIERLREVPIGDLIADALRAKYQTQLAVMNGGGIRASIPSSYAPADLTLRRPATGYQAGPPFDLVMGDVFTVLPFANDAATVTVSGAQVWAMAENGVSALPAANGKFPQISGFKITFNHTLPVGSRVLSIELENGEPITKTSGSYSLATVDFIWLGGDGYSMLVGAPGAVREKLTDAVSEYIKAAGTITPATCGRLVNLAP